MSQEISTDLYAVLVPVDIDLNLTSTPRGLRGCMSTPFIHLNTPILLLGSVPLLDVEIGVVCRTPQLPTFVLLVVHVLPHLHLNAKIQPECKYCRVHILLLLVTNFAS